MTLNYSIIKATNAHSAGITALIFNIWINECSFDVSKEEFPDLAYIEDYYQNKGVIFFIATTDKEIIGTIASDKLDDNTYVLKRMFVKLEFRGQGIAQVLLDKLLENFSVGASLFLSTKEDAAHAAKRF